MGNDSKNIIYRDVHARVPGKYRYLDAKLVQFFRTFSSVTQARSRVHRRDFASIALRNIRVCWLKHSAAAR